MRRSKRQSARVDYAAIGRIDGLSDGEYVDLQGDSDSDEFVIDEAEAEAAEEDEADLMDLDDAGEDEDTEVKVEEQEDETDLVIGDDSQELQFDPKPRASRMPRTKAATAAKERPANSASRPDSLRDRMVAFHGRNNKALLQAVENRTKWSSHMFVPTRDMLQEPTFNATAKTIDQRDQAFEPLKSLDRYATDTQMIRFQTCVDGPVNTLEPFQCSIVPQEGYCLVNAGGYVNCVEWLPSMASNSNDRFLAVSCTMGVFKNISDPALAMFNASASPGLIQVYRFPRDGQPSLVGRLAHDYGPVASMKLRPRGKASDRDGVFIAACFQDGKARVLDLQSLIDSGKDMYCQSPTREYGFSSVKITALCWRGPNELCVGTSDGCVAEFDVCDTSDPSPSYVVPRHDSFICGMDSAYPDYEQFICTKSGDGFDRITDVRDLRRVSAASVRIRAFAQLANTYCHYTKSFLSLEDTFTVKLTTLRKADFIQSTGMTRHDGNVLCVAASLLHPYILSGAADGSVKLASTIRKTTVTKRHNSAVHRQALLWQCQYSLRQQLYRLITLNKSQELPKQQFISHVTIFPPESMVTSLSWHPEVQYGTWYAAGLSNGLVRVQDLVED